MAVMTVSNPGRHIALAFALVAAALPGLAMAEPDNNERGNWNRGNRAQAENRAPAENRVHVENRAEQPALDRGNRGGWGAGQTTAPQVQQQQARQQQQSWGGNRGGWNDGQMRDRPGQNGPAPQVGQAVQPPASAQTRWNGADRHDAFRGRADRSHDGFRGTDNQNDNSRWRGNRGENDHWRSDQYRQNQYRNSDGWNDGNRWAHQNSRDNDDRRWDSRWRENNRYNWSSYRSYHPDRYRMKPYYAPYRGYSYRRLDIGFTLNSLFFGQSYWINDPWSYRLPDVYGPYRWVRYYDDALLVNIYDGQVVDVIHDFFW